MGDGEAGQRQRDLHPHQAVVVQGADSARGGGAGGDAGGLRGSGGPALQLLLGPGQHLVRIKGPNHRKGHPVCAVALAMVARQRLAGEGSHGLRRAQHRVPQGMLAPVGSAQLIHHPHGGLLGVHRDLFENHTTLGFDVCRPQGGPQQFSQRLQQLGRLLGQGCGVVDRGLLAGKGVCVSAQLVEARIQGGGVQPLRPLEHQVFEEV